MSSENKLMYRLTHLGACPKCNHSQFVVDDIDHNIYLTNRDGEIIDSANVSHRALGMCVNCRTKFRMMQTSYGFIPLTPMREILYDTIEQDMNNTKNLPKNFLPVPIDNPMEADTK